MNTNLSVNQLWHLAQSLSADNKRWLAEKLYQSVEEEEEHLTPYTMEEINAWIDESEADEEAGRTYTCAEVKQMMNKKALNQLDAVMAYGPPRAPRPSRQHE